MTIELKPEDAWSLDSTIASVLAQGLDMLIEGPAEQAVDIEKAQAIFAKYCNRWVDDDVNPYAYDKPETHEAKELRWALRWLKNNFTSLWD